jgi:hypothetical protein
LIAQEVANWNIELNKYGKLVLEGIGTIVKQQSTLVFKPLDTQNFNPNGFGLPKFKVEPINNEADMTNPRPVPPVRRVDKRESVRTTNEAETKEGVSVEENEKSNIWKVLLVVLPIIAILGFGGFYGYNHFMTKSIPLAAVDTVKSTKTEEASIVSPLTSDEQNVTETAPVDDGWGAPVQQQEAANEVVTTAVTEIKDNEDVASTNTKPYAIIIASLPTKALAEEFVSQKGGVIIYQAGRYRVAKDYFETIDDAKNALDSYTTYVEKGNPWISKIK